MLIKIHLRYFLIDNTYNVIKFKNVYCRLNFCWFGIFLPQTTVMSSRIVPRSLGATQMPNIGVPMGRVII